MSANQLVVFTGLLLKDESAQHEMIHLLAEQGFTGFEYVDQFDTLPGQGGPGGRSDVIMKMTNISCVSRFAIWRLGKGISWWEDYVDNNKEIIPSRILKRYPKSW